MAQKTGPGASRALHVLCGLLALLVSANALAQTTWYVCSEITGADPGGITGADSPFAANSSDLNAGTDPAFPLRTLGPAGLQGRMANGDVAYLSGRFYTPDEIPCAFKTIVSCNGRTFVQWPGRPPAMIRGANKAGLGGWAPAGVAAFTKNIGASLGSTLATVVFDYDSTANIEPLGLSLPAQGLGRRRGHLVPGTLAEVLAAGPGASAGRFHYDNGTGVLTVSLPGGVSPASAAANGIEYSVRARIGFFLSADHANDRVNGGNTFSGLRLALWADSNSPSPMGSSIAVSSGHRTTISHCIFEDSGIHSYSFGQRCSENICDNNIHIGMAAGGIACVFNASGLTAGVPNASIGCRIVNDTVYANGLLAHDGSVVDRTRAVGAFVCHGPAADIELMDFQVVEYEPPPGAAPSPCAAFTMADAPLPADPFDPNSYAVRVVQSTPSLVTLSNGTAWPNQGIDSNAAYVNCVFRFPRLSTTGATSMIDLRSVTGTTAFFGCEFVADLGNPAVPVAMFTIGLKSSIVNVNCSGYDSSTVRGPQAYSIYRYAVKGGTIYDFQSAWGFRSSAPGTNHVCTGDGAIGSAYHWFLDPAFWNVSTGGYSDNPAFNTAPEWSTVIDPVLGGETVHLAENPFADQTGSAGLAPGEPFKALQKLVAVHTERGVNGQPYDGRYGAHQFGGPTCPADFNQDEFVNGDDFDAFVIEFIPGNAAADINHDGFVSGDDFDEFVARFESGC